MMSFPCFIYGREYVSNVRSESTRRLFGPKEGKVKEVKKNLSFP
jgi:hypothetical protein